MNGFRGPVRRGGPQGPVLSSGSSVAAGTSHGSGTAVILRESLANNGKTPPTAPQLENLPAEPPFAGALALRRISAVFGPQAAIYPFRRT